MWLNYLQAVVQILHVVNGLMLLQHGNPKITGIIGTALAILGQITNHTSLNTMPPKEKP